MSVRAAAARRSWAVRDEPDGAAQRAPAHRPVRPPQRRQVVAAERASPGRTCRSSRTTPGTTTDPVEKPMELLPLGPVLFIDTAGIDDEGALGELRMREDPAGVRPHRPRRAGGRGRRVGRVRGGAARRAARPRGAGGRGLQQDAISASPTRPLLARLERAEGRARARPPRSPATGVGDLREALLAAAPADFLDARRIVADLVAAGRAGGAGGADRQGGAQGPADPAAGADDPRPARRRRRSAWSSRNASCAPRWSGLEAGRRHWWSPTRRRS